MNTACAAIEHETISASDSAQAYYLYAIGRQHGDKATTDARITGIVQDTTIHQVGYRDLRAFISAVPLAQFGTEALQSNLHDTDWVRDRVLAHQRVLAELFAHATILPCAFCTLYYEETRVHTLLEHHYDTLAQSLQHVSGATEWGVKIFSDRSTLNEWVAATAPTLESLRASVERASPGASYLLRKKLNQAADKLADELGAAFMRECHEMLSACARAVAIAPVQSPQIHGHQATMVLNGAYLVD
ncbi:MAG: GvpL/GvpF family gas vesicle protein, partial [Chloroflexales bacterium]|nr:GvpL/GvpF family gas vesicle protein [Chloroflexales bacterium]